MQIFIGPNTQHVYTAKLGTVMLVFKDDLEPIRTEYGPIGEDERLPIYKNKN